MTTADIPAHILERMVAAYEREVAALERLSDKRPDAERLPRVRRMDLEDLAAKRLRERGIGRW